jgi:hypothetical protein
MPWSRQNGTSGRARLGAPLLRPRLKRLTEGRSAMLMSVDDRPRRWRGLATIGLVAAEAMGTLGCGGDDSGLSDPIGSTSTDPIGGTSLTATTSAMTTTDSAQSSTLTVDGVLRAGEEFQVSFTGRLRALRGGYLWVQTLDGAQVALLRGDGNPEIPIEYTVNPAEFEMLDDGLTGERSTFVLPPDLGTGRYELCTANSVPEACVEVEVQAG